MTKVLNVVGARPNFMKIAPLYDAMKASGGAIEPLIVHTGQHYDRAMSELFFEQLGMPEPDHYLGVGSGGHGVQTGRVMMEFEPVVEETKPDLVLVVGDVNSTIACSLVATKMGIPVAHVEAGLRSFDRAMPEEINRILTDQISDLLFVSEPSGMVNLDREGLGVRKAFHVGNVMIDSLLHHKARADEQPTLDEIGVKPKEFLLTTLHRPSNVDNPEILGAQVEVLCELASELSVVFPVHPRTKGRLEAFGLWERLEALDSVHLMGPLGYLDFLCCMSNARMVVTDSGGIQEETTALGVPCITARENTERPVTVDVGTNQLVGQDPANILAAAKIVLAGKSQVGSVPELWDGHASERIVEILKAEL